MTTTKTAKTHSVEDRLGLQKPRIPTELKMKNTIVATLAVAAASSFRVDGFASYSRHPKLAFPKQRSIPMNHFPVLSMSVEGDFNPDAISRAREEVASGSIKARLRALYKFTRPHTIRGTILGSIAGTTRALIDTPGAIANANWGVMLPRAIAGMIALLLGNAFIVGINQIYDKEIDELNKPFLPVASGEMSNRAAWVAVIASGVLGPIVVYVFLVNALQIVLIVTNISLSSTFMAKRYNLFPLLLFKLYTFGLFIGGIYSVPPIRTKKNPLLAGLTIATVRGFLLNFGVYYAVKDAMGAAFAWSPKVSFVARFMTAYATVIAVTKDLPDIEGDKVSSIWFSNVRLLSMFLN